VRLDFGTYGVGGGLLPIAFAEMADRHQEKSNANKKSRHGIGVEHRFLQCDDCWMQYARHDVIRNEGQDGAAANRSRSGCFK
jgi:hypothetical protein